VLVLLHTQIFCALVAATDGSTFEKVTSLRPLIRTRPGTDALIVTDPVEVDPKVPWVEASAGSASSSEAAAPARRAARKALNSIKTPSVILKMEEPSGA
jgi:hypothetical protein